MNPNGAREIRFRPSRVEGISDALEVTVHRDRFGVQTTTQLYVFPFLSFAQYREVVSRRVPVGELCFSKSRYPDSHFVFYTAPRITIFMPADGPTAYPDSHFWQIQELLREGGFKFYEDGPPKHPQRVLNPSWRRTPFYILLVLALAWLFALSGSLSGHAGETIRRFMLSNPRNPSIGIAFAFPMMLVSVILALRHGSTLGRLALMIALSFLITQASELGIRWAIEPRANLNASPFLHRVGSTHHLVTHFIAVSVFALVGTSWRYGCVEPISDQE